jgi:hypothetical protein
MSASTLVWILPNKRLVFPFEAEARAAGRFTFPRAAREDAERRLGVRVEEERFTPFMFRFLECFLDEAIQSG